MTTLDQCGPDRWPDVGNTETTCCYGSANDGPGGCTCWTPVHDLDQAEPRTELNPGMRATMCADCAYRPGSPERAGDPDAAGDLDELRRLVDSGDPFWCHSGMRRRVEWRHPSGATVPGSPLDYNPPIETVRGSATPYKADGTPGEMCGGWALQRLKKLQEGPVQPQHPSEAGSG